MCRTVYFADKSVTFTSESPAAGCFEFTVAATGEVSRAKIQKILETHNCVAVVAADPRQAFDAFAAGFTPVEAAGGVVVNVLGEWLMIRRNGRWDLPKGHVECDEQAGVCAAREIAEETGVCDAEVVRPLCETLHAYYFPKTSRWELKRTHWFELRVVGPCALSPQTEEGIDDVVWCSPVQVAANLRDAFPTIRCVARAMVSGDNTNPCLPKSV